MAKVKVKFIGEIRRSNQFGTFDPGRTYDVEPEIASKLLTCKMYFELVSGSLPEKTKPVTVEKKVDSESTADDDSNVHDDTVVANKTYDEMSVGDLRQLCQERGLKPGRRQKPGLIELLKENEG